MVTWQAHRLLAAWVRAKVGPDLPTWGSGSGPRVLVEEPDRAMAWAVERALEREGFQVAVCHGPSALAAGCPLLERGACPLADEASAIVTALALSRHEGRAVLAGHVRRQPRGSICVEVLGSEAAHYSDEVAGTRTMRVPVTRPALLAAVRRAIKTPKRP